MGASPGPATGDSAASHRARRGGSGRPHLPSGSARGAPGAPTAPGEVRSLGKRGGGAPASPSPGEPPGRLPRRPGAMAGSGTTPSLRDQEGVPLPPRAAAGPRLPAPGRSPPGELNFPAPSPEPSLLEASGVRPHVQPGPAARADRSLSRPTRRRPGTPTSTLTIAETGRARRG